MKFLKILTISNIIILLLYLIGLTIGYISDSFINWKFSNYIDFIWRFESLKEFREYYVIIFFISFMYTFIHMCMDASNNDDDNNYY